jgi:hypothetical protein
MGRKLHEIPRRRSFPTDLAGLPPGEDEVLITPMTSALETGSYWITDGGDQRP